MYKIKLSIYNIFVNYKLINFKNLKKKLNFIIN